MRRIARTVAASAVIIFGLAMVSVAAVGASDVPTAKLPEAPPPVAERGVIPPLNPNIGNAPVNKTEWNAPSVFDSEFGKRGEHEVSVFMSAPTYYRLEWRGGKVEEGIGLIRRTLTVKGGFPLVQLAINGVGQEVSCSVTVDGIKKDSQTTTTKVPVVFCEG